MQDLLILGSLGARLSHQNCKLRLMVGLCRDLLGELRCSPRPRGGLACQETGRFPGWPLFQEVYQPLAYTRIYFTDNQLRQSADRLGIQCTVEDVSRMSPSERMTVMCLKLFLMRHML